MSISSIKKYISNFKKYIRTGGVVYTSFDSSTFFATLK